MRGRWGERVFGVLMRVYPRSFRAAYGRELRDFFRQDRVRQVRGVVPLRLLRWTGFWVGTVFDTLRTGMLLRARAHRGEEGMMGGWLRDLRHTLRALRADPAFVGVALLTVVAGVGSAAAMFSVVDGVVLRPLPYTASERLVFVGSFFEDRPGEPGAVSIGDGRELRRRTRTLDRVAWVGESSDVLVGSADPESVDLGIASPEFFELFGGEVVAGRPLVASDYAAGAAPVAVLEHGFWVRRFGADPSVVGRELSLERTPLTIVGVLAPEVRPPARVRGVEAVAWRALRADEDDNWYSLSSHLVGRTAPGEDLGSVAAELERLGPEISDAFHPEFPYGYRAQDLRERIVGDFSETGRVLMLAAGLLLLIGCANLANLALTRRVDREHEMSLRTALGASRGGIARLVALENGCVAAAGSALGLAFAGLAVEALRRTAPGGIPRLAEVTVDLRIAAFAGVAATLVALLAGLAPGLRRTDPGQSLTGTRRAGTGREVVRFRRVMVIGETALALVMLTSAALLVRSFQELSSRDTGLEVRELGALRVDVRRTLEGDEQRAFFDELETRVSALPGVEGASWISVLPFTSDGMMNRMTLERTSGDGDLEDFLPLTSVSPSFFSTTGVEAVRGRPLRSSDVADAAPVAVANEAFVARYLPNEAEVLGLRFWYGERGEGEAVEIVGVVEDVAYRLASGPLPQLFVPVAQSPWGRNSLLVRSTSDPAGAVAAARREARALQPTLPVDATTLETLYQSELARPRFYALLIGAFAVLAGLLALVGMYGTISYAVRRRTRELGIRMALGARAGELVGAVVRGGLRDAAWGIALGLLGSLATVRAVEAYLYEVPPHDLRAFGTAALLLLVASLVAAWLPARRVAGMDARESIASEA